MNGPRHRKIYIGIAGLLVAILVIVVILLYIKRNAEEDARRTADRQSVGAPVVGTSERVTLTVASGGKPGFRQQEVTVALPPEPVLRAREVLRALLNEYLKSGSSHPLTKGSEVKNVYLLSDGTAVLDLTAALVDGHPSGILEEQMTIASMVETMSANVSGIHQVKILVDGKERETLAGHADLTALIEVADIHKFVQEMQ